MAHKRKAPKMGIDTTASCRPAVDKSVPVNELENQDGKEFAVSPPALERRFIPVIPAESPQLSEGCALEPSRRDSKPPSAHSHLDSQTWLAARAQQAKSDTGDFAMSNKKNPFRLALGAIPAPSSQMGQKRATFVLSLPLALKALFIEEKTLDTTTLIREAAPWTTADEIDMNLYEQFMSCVEEGWIRTEVSGAAGKGRTPVAFDLTSSRSAFQPSTLKTVLEAYLASGAATTAKSAALAATRCLLALPRHARTPEILSGASAVTDRVLHGLPSRLLTQALLRGDIEKKSAQNLASALRATISYGLEHNLFVLYFPERRPTDSYLRAIDAAFPVASAESTAQHVLAVRCGLLKLSAVLRDDLGRKEIGDVKEEDVRSAISLLKSPLRSREYQLVKTLRTLAMREAGAWERTAWRPILTALVATRHTPAIPYLNDRAVIGANRHLPKMLELLRRAALPDSWQPFLEWYCDFSCDTEDDLLARPDEFPIRQPQRHLTPATFANRFAVIRAYVGVAIHLMGLAPAELEPERVFGELFQLLSKRIRAEWSDRVGNGVSHRASEGLHHLLYTGGLLAEALYVRSLHTRSVTVAMQKRAGATVLDYAEHELAADRTLVERSLFESYRYAQKTCANLTKARTDDSPLGSGNTVKDLAEVVAQAPVSVYTRVQEHLLEKVRESSTTAGELGHGERVRVVATMLNGILLSAGLRLGEPGTLRIGIHLPADFDVEMRFILRHIDRKNHRRHPFTFRELFLPSWFLAYYRTVVWPFLLQLGGHDTTPFPWLLLNPGTGKPYVNEDEGLDGKLRSQFVRKDRTKDLAAMWKRAIGDACRDLGIDLPSTDWTVTPHCVRNVVANEIFKEQGERGAAAFLGDREDAVVGVYGMLDGMSVDSSKVIGRARAK